MQIYKMFNIFLNKLNKIIYRAIRIIYESLESSSIIPLNIIP